MPAPVFTTRFCLAYANATWVIFTVPVGKRAVVKSIVVSNSKGDASQYAVVRIANHQALLRYPAADATEAYALTQACYSGETIEALVNGSQIACYVSGFLFDDPNGVADLEEAHEVRDFEDSIYGRDQPSPS